MSNSILPLPVRLSKYVDPPDSVIGFVWKNRYDASRIGIGPHTKAIIDDLLNAEDNSNLSLIHDFVYWELIEAGYLIPAEVVSEDEYLTSILPLRKVPSFLGVPRANTNTLPDEPSCVFLGIPSHLGSQTSGAANGPKFLRQASKRHSWRSSAIADAFTLDGSKHPATRMPVFDCGDIVLPRTAIDSYLAKVEEIISSLPHASIPIILGGDHSFTYATVRALMSRRDKPTHLIQFDHHLDVDFYGPHSSTGPVKPKPVDHSNFISNIHAEFPDLKITQIGVDHYNCAESGSSDAMRSHLSSIGTQISNVHLTEIEDEDVLRRIPEDGNIYVSFDVDVICAEEMSSTGNPAYFGISFARSLSLLKKICTTRNIIGVDFMEFGVADQFMTLTVQREADRIVLLIAEVLSALSSRMRSS